MIINEVCINTSFNKLNIIFLARVFLEANAQSCVNGVSIKKCQVSNFM